MTENLPQDKSPAAMLLNAMASGTDLEKLEKFMELQERYERNEARKAYHEAMAAFKANDVPKIEKDRKVTYETSKGNTSYSHASLANVTDKITAALGKYGLSHAWRTKQDDKMITVTCTISHRQGYSEETSLSAAPDQSGSKNSIQAVGSTITYLERYTLLALTGLAASDTDDDGMAGREIKYISEDQVKAVNDLIKAKNVELPAFLNYMQSKSVEMIQAKDFQKAMQALKVAKGKPKQEEKKKTIPCPNKDGKEVNITDCDSCESREGCPSWD